MMNPQLDRDPMRWRRQPDLTPLPTPHVSAGTIIAALVLLVLVWVLLVAAFLL